MPNWCSTDYKIKGTLKSVKKVHDIIAMYTDGDHTQPKQDFGAEWIGNIVVPEELQEWGSYRGTVSVLDVTDNGDGTAEFEMTTFTAWAPMHGFIKGLNEKYSLGLDIEYYAEEPGCLLYAASSKEMTEGKEYRLDYYFEDETEEKKFFPDGITGEMFVSEDELYELLKAIPGDNLEAKADKAADMVKYGFFSANKILFEAA